MVRSAVILAGGPGGRMWPFSRVRNKAAMPVANVPNVRRQADDLGSMGVSTVVVVVGTESGSIRHALAGCGVTVVFVEQPSSDGTADALLRGMRSAPDGPVLALFGDVVTPRTNLCAVASAFESGSVAGAVLVEDVHPEEGADWYTADVRDGLLGVVTGHEADSATRVLGVMALDRSIEPVLASNPGYMRSVPVGGMPPAESDVMQSLNDWCRDVAAVQAVDWVVDMDKPWHVLEANARMCRTLAAGLTQNRIDATARIDDGAEIDGFVDLGPGSVIGRRVIAQGGLIVGADSRVVNGAILKGPVVIGDRCRVSDYCNVDGGSVIGNQCIVGHGAEFDGVMFDGSYLYHYCEISGVVGSSVDIGAATVCGTLRFDDGPTAHRVLGRREIPIRGSNASFFGDYSRTGVNVITTPGAKIGVYSCVGPGVVVYEDVPDETMVLIRQDLATRPWGPRRYGW